jgi:CBS domain containing-hemolysin-like protein
MSNSPRTTPALASPARGEESRHSNDSWWQKLRSFVRPPPDAEDLREVVEEILEEPLSESGLSPAERMLLGNIMTLRERRIGDCMLPRADIISADVEANLKELIDLMAAHAHSRIPIYRGTLDDVIGMVHMKDILPCLAYGQERTIADLLRPVLFVAPSMPAGKLLLQMRQSRQHMAMVVDEFGGVDGLVTMEDLMEEIVGEIEDEHDAPPAPTLIARADGTLLVDARLSIADFANKTGFNLPPLEGEDIDTLGGYVANLAGHVPRIGEKVAGNSFHFEVLEMDQGRIRRLRIRPVHKPENTITAESRTGAV